MLPLPISDDTCVLILTGAGISAESGVPTFRDAGGLWEGHDVREVATPAGFARDPLLVWRFYAQRRAALDGIVPIDRAHLNRIEGFVQAASPRLVFVAIGNSGLVEPAASLVDAARQVGGASWLVNAEAPANVDRFDHVVLGAAGALVPQLLAG